MAEEGLRVVRQWLEASSQLEEGERHLVRLVGRSLASQCSQALITLPVQPQFTADGK
jgi:hypothetical protein